MTIAPELFVVGTLRVDEDAETVIKAWRRFQQRHGATITWQDYGTGRWSGASKVMWERLPKNLGRGGWRKALHSFHLHGGDSHDSPAVPALDLFLEGRSGQLTWRWMGAPNEPPGRFMTDVKWLLSTLPVRWGFGGLGLYGPGYGDATGGRRDAVGDALIADPWLGTTHPAWGVVHDGVCNSSWLTALGPEYVSRLGGREQLSPALDELGLEVTPAGASLLIRAGSTPRLDQTTRESMRGLWRLLDPVKPDRASVDDNAWVPGLTLDEMKQWVDRWA